MKGGMERPRRPDVWQGSFLHFLPAALFPLSAKSVFESIVLLEV